jgi:hypothetical protein
VTRDELISEEYLREQERLHAAPRGYGGRGNKWSPVVDELLRRYRCGSMLDYGCGQGSLVRTLSNDYRFEPAVEFREYDPAIPEKSELPSQPCDLVVCTDVLEHIESDRIFAVMQHLGALTEPRALRGDILGADEQDAERRPAGAHTASLGRVVEVSVCRGWLRAGEDGEGQRSEEGPQAIRGGLVPMREIAGFFWPDDVAERWRHSLRHVEALDWTLKRCAGRRTAVQAGGNMGLWPRKMAEAGFRRVLTFEPDDQ